MKKILFLVIALSVIGIIANWYFFTYKKTGIAKKETPLQEITLKLKWKHQAQFAGHYVAAEKGFYKEEGLKVNIEEFSGGENPIDTVLSNKADFGVEGADNIIISRTEGKNIKAIGVIYKVNPAVVFSLKSSSILKPQDLTGKKVGLASGSNLIYSFRAMISKIGVDSKKVQEVPIGYGINDLISGKVDAMAGYLINEPYLASNSGHPVNVILMADYGVNMYADTLFASDATVTNKPDLVLRFLRATLKGWQYAIENDDEAVQITMKYAKNSTVDHETYILRKSVPLINSGSSNLGMMDQTGWLQAQSILLGQKMIDKKIMITDVFSMNSLNQIYNSK